MRLRVLWCLSRRMNKVYDRLLGRLGRHLIIYFVLLIESHLDQGQPRRLHICEAVSSQASKPAMIHIAHVTNILQLPCNSLLCERSEFPGQVEHWISASLLCVPVVYEKCTGL